jgi:hypothetical protein
MVCELVMTIPRGANIFSLNMSRTASLARRWIVHVMLPFIYRMTSSGVLWCDTHRVGPKTHHVKQAVCGFRRLSGLISLFSNQCYPS